MSGSCASLRQHEALTLCPARTGSGPPFGDRWSVHLTAHKDDPKYGRHRYGWGFGTPQLGFPRRELPPACVFPEVSLKILNLEG